MVYWRRLFFGILTYLLARLLLGTLFQPTGATMLAMVAAFAVAYRSVPEGRFLHGLLAALGGYAGTILLTLVFGALL